MARRSREYLPTLLLGLLALTLALAVALERKLLSQGLDSELGPPPKPRPVPVEDTAGDSADFRLPPLDAYRQMTARPLFMDNRRPGSDAPEVIPPPPPPPSPMNLKLMGIVSTPKEKTALLIDGKGKYKRLKARDLFDGWMLVELGADKVTVQQGDRREVLPLLKKKPKTAQPGQPMQPGQSQVPPPGRPMPPAGRPLQPMSPAPMPPGGMGDDVDNGDVSDPGIDNEIQGQDADTGDVGDTQ